MFTEIGGDIAVAANFLKRGETVAIPTETVYGLAANALNEEAVLKIFQVKNRPHFDPLIIHVHSIQEIYKWARNFDEHLLNLMKIHSPGPLTVILPKTNLIPDITTSGLDHAAFRIPNHPIALELLKKLPFPLAAPSANPFGYVSPTTSQHVFNQLNGKIPYILEGGQSEIGLESTILGFEKNNWIIYRWGGLTEETIKHHFPNIAVTKYFSSEVNAPGMLKSHYAPLKNLYVGEIEKLRTENLKGIAGVISFKSEYNWVPKGLLKVLSPTGNLNEAAKNLFSSIRELDNSSCNFILAEIFPDEGLGKAINDRLTKASINK